MNRDQIDLELLTFLREMKEREQREENGMRAAIGNLAAQVQVLSTKIEANHEITQERIKGLASRVDVLERDAEDTGVHNLAELREKAASWPRRLEHVAIAVVVTLLSVGITYAVTKNAGAAENAAHVAEKASHQ